MSWLKEVLGDARRRATVGAPWPRSGFAERWIARIRMEGQPCVQAMASIGPCGVDANGSEAPDGGEP